MISYHSIFMFRSIDKVNDIFLHFGMWNSILQAPRLWNYSGSLWHINFFTLVFHYTMYNQYWKTYKYTVSIRNTTTNRINATRWFSLTQIKHCKYTSNTASDFQFPASHATHTIPYHERKYNWQRSQWSLNLQRWRHFQSKSICLVNEILIS